MKRFLDCGNHSCFPTASRHSWFEQSTVTRVESAERRGCGRKSRKERAVKNEAWWNQPSMCLLRASAVIRKCDALQTGRPSRNKMAWGVSCRMPRRAAMWSETVR